MSDKQWTRESFDVLMDDGTEYLDVTITYGDRIKFAKFAAERKESAADAWQVATAGHLWCALARLGHISDDYSWPRFWPHVADWDKRPAEPVDPTPPVVGSG